VVVARVKTRCSATLPRSKAAMQWLLALIHRRRPEWSN